METVQPIKKIFLVLGPVGKSASKTLRSHNKIKKSSNMNRSTVFVTFLSLVTFQLGVGLWAPSPPPPPLGYAYMPGSFVFEIRKLLATSEAEFNSSISAGMGSKPSGTKAAVIFD